MEGDAASPDDTTEGEHKDLKVVALKWILEEPHKLFGEMIIY